MRHSNRNTGVQCRQSKCHVLALRLSAQAGRSYPIAQTDEEQAERIQRHHPNPTETSRRKQWEAWSVFRAGIAKPSITGDFNKNAPWHPKEKQKLHCAFKAAALRDSETRVAAVSNELSAAWHPDPTHSTRWRVRSVVPEERMSRDCSSFGVTGSWGRLLRAECRLAGVRRPSSSGSESHAGSLGARTGPRGIGLRALVRSESNLADREPAGRYPRRTLAGSEAKMIRR